jgi:hypothetical protein
MSAWVSSECAPKQLRASSDAVSIIGTLLAARVQAGQRSRDGCHGIAGDDAYMGMMHWWR